jgi:hypothetical protein
VRPNHFTRALGFCLCFALGVSHADPSDTLTPPFTDVHTIAAVGAPVPVEHDFSITATGAYQIVLTDLGAQLTTPQPLTSVTLAVTTGGTLVGKALVGTGAYKFNALTTGAYTVHVVGTPTNSVGSIGLKIGTAANPTSLGTYSDDIQAQTGVLPANTAILDDSFTVDNSGSYVISLADLQVPQGLATLTLAVTETSGGIVQILPDANNAMQATVSLSSGTSYTITAIGVAGVANAGLFSATVTPQAGGTPIYGKAVPVGATIQVGTPTLTAGNHTVTLTDLAFPASLTQLAAAVMLNGQSATATPLAAGGTQNFTAVAGTYQVFAVATPQTASPAAGAYSLQIQPTGGAPELSLARAVTDSASNLTAYGFDSTFQNAGAYVVTLTDFSFPAALNAARLAAVQNGALIGTPLNTVGTLNLNAQAGPISYLVIAQADPANGGLFDLNVTASGSTALLFDATQGVGTGFISRKVTITAGGMYGISSSDVGFPTSFSNLALVVTQGASNLGNIFSLGNLSLTATPGDYFINLVAKPAAGAGTYALVMAPVPTVTLTPSATSVSQGSTVTLNWSTQNATTCTAKDGWSGSQQVSGTFTSGALSANTVFTLSCTGPGGTSSTSVNVTVTSAPPPSSGGGGGGGGAIDEIVVIGLATLLARRLRTLRQ